MGKGKKKRERGFFLFFFSPLFLSYISALLLVKVFRPAPKDPSCRPEGERSRRKEAAGLGEANYRKRARGGKPIAITAAIFSFVPFLYCPLLDLALLRAGQVPS
ncbi:hypothetical protein V8C26DRAFT_273061 [Trichoderma gracile]